MKAAVTIDPVKLALSVPVAASTDLAAEVGLRTWIARLRTDRVAIFRASVSRTFNAAAAEASGVTGLAVEDLAAVIASAVGVASVAVVVLADSAAEVGAADGNN